MHKPFEVLRQERKHLSVAGAPIRRIDGHLWHVTGKTTRLIAVYLQRAVQALRAHGRPVDEALLPYLSPLG